MLGSVIIGPECWQGILNVASGRQAPEKVEARERRKYVLYLRRRGKSYETIAHELDISPTRAWQIVKAAYDELLLDTQRDTAEVRDQEVERMDAMLDAIWDRVKEGDEKAIDRALRIQERRAKLMGLDSPTQLDHRSGDGSMSPTHIEITTPDDDSKD